jgi:hypothetical protein
MITLKINNVDLSSLINWESLTLEQILTNQVDTLTFEYSKYGSRTYTPAINDEVTIYEGATKIFGGYIMNIAESNLGRPNGIAYQIQCADYSVKFGGILATKSYTSQTIAQIVTDLISVYGAGFTANNVICSFVVTKIAFNEMYLSDCLKKLADIVKYDWYVDETKDLHFFPKMTNAAPYNLTDTSGNYINETLSRNIDGTQIVNQVKVRGGEGDGATYTDIITVNGSITKTFKLPYQFSNLVIEVDVGAGYVIKTVGQDFKDDAALFDCLYSYNDSMVKFPAVLADGNKIRFTGNPKVPIKSIVSNSSSILLYGLKEKIINDATIVDITIARKRAKAELLAYQYGSTEINFDTYDIGLRAGMVIGLNSTKRAVNDSFIINKISFKTTSPTEFYYSVNAITTNKMQLIDLLQKLVSPNQGTLDDNVIAENINTDMADIDVTEIIRLVVPHLDRVDLELSETVWKDPLGANIEPTWVLGPYAPTSASDPKRWGLLDNSLKLY